MAWFSVLSFCESRIVLHGLVGSDILDDHSETSNMNAYFEGTSCANGDASCISIAIGASSLPSCKTDPTHLAVDLKKNDASLPSIIFSIKESQESIIY